MATLKISELSETAFWDEAFFERLQVGGDIKRASAEANEALKARRAAFRGSVAELKVAAADGSAPPAETAQPAAQVGSAFVHEINKRARALTEQERLDARASAEEREYRTEQDS